jgi:hypothetical protein
MNRRYALRNAALPLLALVAALTVSSHSSWGQAKQAAVPGTLEGTWIVAVTPGPGGPPPFQVLATFTSNGGFIATGPSGPAVAQGSWAQTGDRTFNLTFLTFSFDSKGQLAVSQKTWQGITVSQGFDAWSGPSKVEIRDPTGKLLLSGTGSVQATRMRAEPIP